MNMNNTGREVHFSKKASWFHSMGLQLHATVHEEGVVTDPIWPYRSFPRQG